jgi:hypothetical protein
MVGRDGEGNNIVGCGDDDVEEMADGSDGKNRRKNRWLTNGPHLRGRMVISPVHLTPLDAKTDGMVWRSKDFRWMAHRCERTF